MEPPAEPRPPQPTPPEPAPEPSGPPPEQPRTADDVLRLLSAEAKAEARQTAAPPNIARCLLAEGPITNEFLHQQLAVSGKGETYLGRILARVHAVSEAELLEVVGAGYRVPQVDLKQIRVPIPIATSIPREVALKYRAVPIDRIGDILCVGFAEEPNPKAVEGIRRATGLRVKALRCPAHHVKILLRRLFPPPTTQQVAAAIPISERDYEEAVGGPEARWEATHATRGPIRARRLAQR
jgi:hypothetical protein